MRPGPRRSPPPRDGRGRRSRGGGAPRGLRRAARPPPGSTGPAPGRRCRARPRPRPGRAPQASGGGPSPVQRASASIRRNAASMRSRAGAGPTAYRPSSSAWGRGRSGPGRAGLAVRPPERPVSGAGFDGVALRHAGPQNHQISGAGHRPGRSLPEPSPPPVVQVNSQTVAARGQVDAVSRSLVETTDGHQARRRGRGSRLGQLLSTHGHPPGRRVDLT